MTEPTTPEAVALWIATHRRDRFERVRDASVRHREQHGAGCSVYPTRSGPLLGVLAAATRPRRVLELGCGLGYSTLWLAFGAGAAARVDTIERDPEHARVARAHLAAEELADRVTVHEGQGIHVLRRFAPPYDLVFNDGDPEEFELDLAEFVRLLRPGGVLVSANLFLGQYVADLPGLEQAARYRERLLEPPFLTTILADGLALSVARADA